MRRRRVGSGRRRAIVVGSVLVLIAALGVSVRRTANGTRIAGELADLQRAERAAEAQAAEEWARVDSLASRRHVLRVAGRLGLRPAHEDEIIYLSDTTTPDGVGSDGR